MRDDAGENELESFLTRNDAVMRAASSAALFADTKGGGADGDGGWRRWCWRPVLLEAGGALGPASTGRCILSGDERNGGG